MSKILFVGGFILLFIWVIEFFVFHKNGIIHILPAVAIIALVFRLLYNKIETPE